MAVQAVSRDSCVCTPCGFRFRFGGWNPPLVDDLMLTCCECRFVLELLGLAALPDQTDYIEANGPIL